MHVSIYFNIYEASGVKNCQAQLFKKREIV